MERFLLDQIRSWAVDAPDSIALRAPERDSLTYTQLWNRIEALVETFAGSAGQVVAMALSDGPDLAAAVLGTSLRCLSAPLNAKLAAPEFEAYLAALDPSALVVEAGHSSAIAAAERLGISVWELKVAPGSAAGDFSLSCRGESPPKVASAPSDPGLILLTSATTGTPKLVPLNHGNLRAQCLQTAGALQLSAQDRFLSLMPLFHLQGILAIFSQLYAGGSAICAPGFDASRFLDCIEEFQPTWFTASPTTHRAILALLDSGRRAMPCRLRFVRSIGAPLSPDLIASIEAAINAPVIEGYGMTELGAATSNPLPPGRRKPGSVGKSTGAEVAIFDASGQRVAHGMEGEIRIRGAAVTRGYRNNDQANRESFCNGWIRTGDLGRFDEDGYLYVTGRMKEVINRGGEKIMPHEVDAALATHPAVLDAAAFGVPHASLGEDIVAAVVTRPGMTASEADLREFVAGRVAAFKVPRRVLFVDRIPKGATGKPRRMTLREEFGSLWQRASLEDASELELKLVDIWKRILQTEVGVQDDFFAAGGDSLAATVMLAEVRASLAVSPSLLDCVDFFESPTIRTLARIVSECGTTNEKPQSTLLALQPNGYLRPLFLMPDATSDPYYFRNLAKHLGKDQPALALRYASTNGSGAALTVEQVAAHCVKVMRSVQPNGPYRVAGHCFGGIVAFETARQFLAAGEETELLALLDATTPGYPKPAAHWRRYVRALGGAFSADPARSVLAREAVEHVRHVATRVRLMSSARWRRRLATSPLAAALPAIGSSVSYNETAGRNYIPQPAALHVVQFIADDQRIDAKILDDPRLEWRRFASAGFEVRHAPGDHQSMFAEPHVEKLAEQLRALLSRGEMQRTFSAAVR
jgi:acyl-CoA synthetase (AMP-forming)/AMP-acid ligase II/thioesterase domain-containing protein